MRGTSSVPGEGLGERDTLLLGLTLGEMLALTEAETLLLGDWLGLAELDGLTDGLGLGLTLDDGEMLALTLLLGL